MKQKTKPLKAAPPAHGLSRALISRQTEMNTIISEVSGESVIECSQTRHPFVSKRK